MEQARYGWRKNFESMDKRIIRRLNDFKNEDAALMRLQVGPGPTLFS